MYLIIKNMKNMVSNTMKKGMLLCAVIFTLAACSKPFVLDLPLAVDSHEYTLDSDAGEARIFFYTNRAWTLSIEPADCSWATINRAAGDGKEDVEEIIFKYDENAMADRQVAIVIDAGDLQEKINMFQTGSVRDWFDGSVSVDDLVVKPEKPVNP